MLSCVSAARNSLCGDLTLSLSAVSKCDSTCEYVCVGGAELVTPISIQQQYDAVGRGTSKKV